MATAARAGAVMTRRAGAALLVIGAAALAGCATRPPVSSETLFGRIAVRVEGQAERSLSAGFELTGHAAQGHLTLTTPLGTTAAQATWEPGQAWLLADGRRTGYASLDDLAAAALGEPLPIAALFDWLRGRPWPGAPSQPRDDAVAGFVQLGWHIDVSRIDDGWLEARRPVPPAVLVRARLERP